MTGRRYVALGDSYAAGIGSGTRGGRCRRIGGYPILVAHRLGFDLAYQACLSATVDDVLRWQLDPLGADTELVTLTVGGNDAGFAEVVLAAAKPRCLADGVAVIRAARRQTDVSLPRALLRLLTRIRQRAPYARIVVTGYPQLMGTLDCRWYTFFSPAELGALRAGADDLVDLVLDVATRQGAVPVDVRARFADHDACSPDPWVHHVTWPVVDSFHPTAHGHEVYAESVTEALAPLTRTAPEPGVLPRTPAAGSGRPPVVTPGPDHPTSAPAFDLPTLVRAGTLPVRPSEGTDDTRGADGGRRHPTAVRP